MSRFRYYILPRLALAFSVLALLAATALLWFSLERPMPSIALACRQAGPANCFTGSRLLSSGTVRLEHAQPTSDAWAVLQSGTEYALVELERLGPLWTFSSLQRISLSAQGATTLYPFSTALSGYYTQGSTLPATSEFRTELLPLAICTDPSVVRLEGEMLWLGGWEDPQQALDSRGISISWTPAHNGVWVGSPITAPLPDRPDGDGSGGTLSIWCRVYDAAGNLVCSYDPTQ